MPTALKNYIALAALAAYANAECPNACSGHGECGQKDMCDCYNNYQGNDCSERTCYFGIAHVDTPKGDLNADGTVSGPLTTVITGSEVYPWGTTEQYPNADANEGHFYMECSNKGICDRKSGECECFDGYEGTACVRASCPNDCSGHGTCESIKELAEFKGYDTNAGDVPTTQPIGSSNHHNFNSLIEESYSYDLWDADKTMGCYCDPVYYGADCSLKKCKYGVDPLFFDDSDGVIYQSSVVHLGSKGTSAAALKGTFDLVFYDVFGEKYTTKPLTADRSKLTSTKVVEAFEALPNGVISKTNSDVTRTAPAAVSVSMNADAGDTTTAGTLGAGKEGNAGAGVGVSGNYGPEFTVRFTSNPGILKTIEVDTRQISNAAKSDYWVANMRQGQFSSRYTTTSGRVNTLLYGSKYLYTNAAPADLNIAANDLVKVNGAEYLVKSVSADNKQVVLNEPFLGASILPILTDTGVVATAVASGTGAAAFTLEDTATTKVTSANTDNLKEHSALYCQDQPFVSRTTPAIAAVTLDMEDTESWFYFTAAIKSPVYTRTDDPDNQNFYEAASDTAAEALDTYCSMRGTNTLYVCASDTGATKTTVIAAAATAKTITVAATPADTTGFVAHAGLFIGVAGPYRIEGTPSATVTLADTQAEQTSFSDYFAAAGVANAAAPLWYTKTSATADYTGSGVSSNTIVLLGGRRYKGTSATSKLIQNHDATSAAAAAGSAYIGSYIELTETWSGPALEEICSKCVDEVVAGVVGTASTQTFKVGAGTTFNLAANQGLMIGGSASYDKLLWVNAGFTGGDGAGTADVTVNSLTGSFATAKTADAGSTASDLDLFRITNNNGFKPVFVQETRAQTTYQYVSQCSNRGTCDGETGVCTCFKGYTNDNCDTQNMLAM